MLSIIGAIFFLFFIIFLFSKMEDDHEVEKKQAEQELENNKKAEELALEIKRKNHEYELELQKKAGLDPKYQDLQLRLNESQRKIQQYKNIGMIVAAITAIGGLGFLFLKDSGETNSNENYETILAENLNKGYVETEHIENAEAIVAHSKDVLPNRYVPTEENKPVTQIKQSDYPNVKGETEASLEKKSVKTQNENYKVPTTQISVSEVGSFIGQDVTVCGTISQISSSSKATYINFGGYYPKQAFSAVIWSGSNELPVENENICVSGLVESYKGIPQIVIQSIKHQILMQ